MADTGTSRAIQPRCNESTGQGHSSADGGQERLHWQVYKALKTVDILERKPIGQLTMGKSRIIVRNRSEWESIKALLHEYTEEQICISLRTLQHEGVFRSADVAATRFPEPAPASDLLMPDPASHEESEAREKTETSNPTARLQHVVSAEIPYGAQYGLLVYLQGRVEQACYNYGQENIPEVLPEQGWDCAEAVTLERWIEQNPDLHLTLKPESENEVPTGTSEAIADIHRCVVGRVRQDSKGLERLLRGAEDYAELLGDMTLHETTRELRRDVIRALAELRRNEDHLQDNLQKSLSDIAKRRVELDREEQAVINKTKRFKERYETRAGSKIKSAVERSSKAIMVENLDDTDWDDGISQTDDGSQK